MPHVFWKGETNVNKHLRPLRFVFFWVLVALVALVLAGCGDKDEFPNFDFKDPFPNFVGDEDRNGEDAEDRNGDETAVSSASLDLSADPEVLFVTGVDGAHLELGPGDATRIAIQLNRPLDTDLDVTLATVDPAGVLQGVAEPVTIPAGEALGLLTVAVSDDSAPGSEAEIALVPGPDYGVFSEASVFKVLVSTMPVATLTLSGGDYSPVPGEVVLFNLNRSGSTGDLSVPLLVAGDRDSFEVPAQLSFTDGSSSVTFAVKASGADGVAEISFLPPQGYGLGAEPSVRLEIRPN